MERLRHTPLIDLRTPLSLIPDAWRMVIEPHITRPPKGADGFGCWLWDINRSKCRVDNNGEPVIEQRQLDKNARGTILVKYVIAGLYWPDFRHKLHYVYHECGNVNCLAPHHLLVTRYAPNQFDLKKMIVKKRANVKNYQQQVLRDDARSD